LPKERVRLRKTTRFLLNELPVEHLAAIRRTVLGSSALSEEFSKAKVLLKEVGEVRKTVLTELLGCLINMKICLIMPKLRVLN
jgi:hypothetical protein